MLGTLYLAFPFLAQAQTQTATTKYPLFDRGRFLNKKDTLPYRILFPKNFRTTERYPVIFVLHGAGERGNDNEAQLAYGPELFLKDSIRANYPAIVIFRNALKTVIGAT